MCDYSLHAVPNRLATEGEELATYRFPTSSIGLACPADIERATHRETPAVAGRSWWSAMKAWLNPPPMRVEKIAAVCIPPGARLRFSDVPRDLQKELGVESVEEVTFVELSASAYRYRDGIRFRNGREILLQYLDEGLHFDVLSLGGSEASAAPDFHVAEELRLHGRP
ncbi:MAG TPA: hypothetical protein VHA11_14730 [Bryobacteraceae bacterium]|nr:hypothetical protein [Bryobacteraceae bacterium]